MIGGHGGAQMTYDLADRHDDGCCCGNNQGQQSMWIFALAIIALIFFGRGGFGFGGDGGRGAGSEALVLGASGLMNQNDHIQDTVNFNGAMLQRSIDHNADVLQIQNLEKELCGINANVLKSWGELSKEVAIENGHLAKEIAIGNGVLGKETALGFGRTELELAKMSGKTDLEMCKGFGHTAQIIDRNRFDTLREFKNAELRAQECCCETNRHIDKVQFQVEKDKCEVMGAIAKSEAKVLEVLAINRMKDLEDRLAKAELGLSQQRQNEYLVQMIKPCAIPAYPACNPNVPPSFNGFNPFEQKCGC